VSFDDLDRLASFLENPEDLLPDIAAEAGPEIQRVARSEYAQGRGPAGQHAPRKKDGALALQRPLSTVTFAGVGSTIAGSAEDVLRYHQGPIFTAPYPERKTFPGDGDPLPSSWEKAIETSAEKVLDKVLGGLK
jgi:hypothetical protein